MTTEDVVAELKRLSHVAGTMSYATAAYERAIKVLEADSDYDLRSRVYALAEDLEIPYEPGFWEKGTPTGLARRIRRDVLLEPGLGKVQPISFAKESPKRTGRR